MKYKTVISILLISCFHAGISFAQQDIAKSAKSGIYSKHKKITKTFKVSPDKCDIEITNKYGNIHLIPWKKDSVCFEINLIVRAKPESKADKIINYFDFKFTNTRYYVIAQTTFRDYRNSLWNDLSDMAHAIFSSGNMVEVNYVVSFPEKSNLKIDNKFGNIYTTDCYGNLDIILSNGDMKAHDLKGNSKIDISFGDGVINDMNTGQLTISYGEFQLKDAKSLSVNSKSSKITMENIDELKLYSKRDKYYINTIDILHTETYFSYINVKKLNKELITTTKYGSVNIESVASNFQLLKGNSYYTDYNLFFPKDANFRLNIAHTHKTIISYPESYGKVKTETINETEDRFKTSGIVGRINEPFSHTDISITAGTINIYNK